MKNRSRRKNKLKERNKSTKPFLKRHLKLWRPPMMLRVKSRLKLSRLKLLLNFLDQVLNYLNNKKIYHKLKLNKILILFLRRIRLKWRKSKKWKMNQINKSKSKSKSKKKSKNIRLFWRKPLKQWKHLMILRERKKLKL